MEIRSCDMIEIGETIVTAMTVSAVNCDRCNNQDSCDVILKAAIITQALGI